MSQGFGHANERGSALNEIRSGVGPGKDRLWAIANGPGPRDFPGRCKRAPVLAELLEVVEKPQRFRDIALVRGRRGKFAESVGQVGWVCIAAQETFRACRIRRVLADEKNGNVATLVSLN